MNQSPTQSKIPSIQDILDWIVSGATKMTPEDFGISGLPLVPDDDVVAAEEEYSARFLRHVRPYKYEKKMGGMFPTGYCPTGGLTVCVVLDPVNRKFKFSYAICNEDDLFNKKISARICNGRMDVDDCYEVSDYSSGVSTVENIKYALNTYLRPIKNSDTIDPNLPKLTNVPKQRNNREGRQDLSKIVNILNKHY